MTARERPAIGGNRPPYVLEPDYADQSTPEIKALWERRSELIGPYERQTMGSLGLSLGALAFANLVAGVARESPSKLRGAELLPASLGAYLHKERQLFLGPGTPPPVTPDDIDDAPAQKWAAKALQDAVFWEKFTPWIAILQTREFEPDIVPIVRAAVIKAVWPVQVTLEQPAVTNLYQAIVAPLEPAFTPLIDYLVQGGITSTVARGVAARWRRDCYSERGVLFKPKTFKKEIRDARDRLQKNP